MHGGVIKITMWYGGKNITSTYLEQSRRKRPLPDNEHNKHHANTIKRNYGNMTGPSVCVHSVKRTGRCVGTTTIRNNN